jgi:hypothetical protein
MGDGNSGGAGWTRVICCALQFLQLAGKVKKALTFDGCPRKFPVSSLKTGCWRDSCLLGTGLELRHENTIH